MATVNAAGYVELNSFKTMFTENQVRQFYVATSTAADVIAPVEVDSSHAATDLKAKSAGACQFVLGPNKDEFYLQYKGPSDDGLQRSDLIKICNVTDVRLTGTADLVHKMRKLEVVLDSSVNSGAPEVGQDYVLNVDIKNYIASGYNSTKVKFGVAKAKTATASDLYRDLAINLAKNFAREAVPMINIALKTSSSPVPVTSKTKASALTGSYTGIILEEVAQPWRRGAAKVEYVNFDAYASTIYVDGMDQIWGTVNDVTASNTNKLPNTKVVADMEWFFHKERGDVYGEAAFPYNIDTVYQVDPANAYGYSFIDIHYFFEGNSHNVGKSEKTLTVVVPGKASNPEELTQKLVGHAATTGQSAQAATGLYAWLEGTGVSIKVSPNWDPS